MSKIVKIRAKAFSGRGIETVRVMVEGNTVRVWDTVAGHFTTCHSMAKSAIRRAIKVAAAA